MKSDLKKPFLVLAGLLLLSTGRAFAAKDACSLVTADEASTVLGEPVGPPEPENKYGAVTEGSACKFRSTQGKGFRAKSVSVTVHYTTVDVSGSNVGIADNLKSAGFKDVRQISGVGDAAVWGTMSMMGKPMTELSVLKGKRIMVIILINGLPDDAGTLDRAKALAAKVLPRT